MNRVLVINAIKKNLRTAGCETSVETFRRKWEITELGEAVDNNIRMRHKDVIYTVFVKHGRSILIKVRT